eukprot:GHVR01007844.1.p1 GENE.GHVR01007844.1~~GHVR01007844.1.p1  ORF type:complete len:264 (-),score=84.62 GHVR01007844.1:430-1221(-)
MDDIEQAVSCLLDPSVSPSLKKQAQDYCTVVKSSSDVIDLCVHNLNNTCRAPHFRFWCVQTMIEITRTHTHTHTQTHNPTDVSVCDVLKFHVLKYIDVNLESGSEPPYMKSKVAELYVAIMRVIYLTTWDSAVRDICDRSCVGLESFRFFLRVLNEIDTQVSCEDICRTQAERQQNTLLKDRMRCGDMCRLVECCRALLVSSHLLQHNKSLFIDTLAELSKFVSWMDMSLVSNEMFISSLWGLVSVDGVCVCVCACVCIDEYP